ncbi:MULTISPECIES: 4'-phosphopantetheinyl transferase [unclassified Streptomyces]|uniref:4'-phosphopantetheinyl transferase family protein n=1 Tax=unclassified Streptomyces TaxID=2593676 RepID=UPI0038059748
MTGRRRPGGIVHDLVSGAVAAVDSWGEFDGGAVFSQEEHVIARAVPKRRREFTGARHCARRALAELSVPPAPILPGRHGAPVWPAGITGSITHTEDYRAAAVARTADIRAIGIDAEPHQRMPGRTAELVTANAYEAAVLRRLAEGYPGVHWTGSSSARRRRRTRSGPPSPGTGWASRTRSSYRTRPGAPSRPGS